MIGIKAYSLEIVEAVFRYSHDCNQCLVLTDADRYLNHFGKYNSRYNRAKVCIRGETEKLIGYEIALAQVNCLIDLGNRYLKQANSEDIRWLGWNWLLEGYNSGNWRKYVFPGTDENYISYLGKYGCIDLLDGENYRSYYKCLATRKDPLELVLDAIQQVIDKYN